MVSIRARRAVGVVRSVFKILEAGSLSHELEMEVSSVGDVASSRGGNRGKRGTIGTSYY